MPEKPTLLFLHGVGTGDQDDGWKTALEAAMVRLGYPSLDGVTVIAPKYPNALHGVDDDEPLPALTVKPPTGEAAKQNRREFERRESAVEVMLGTHDPGAAWFGGDPIAAASLRLSKFRQAANYLKDPRIRAHVLNKVLAKVPPSGRLVVVGHSLGSVIAADVLRRLPAEVEVVGMVTIGSPLSSSLFHVDGLREALKEPPTNLGWWVSFWHPADAVTTHRGVSSVFPWMTDYRVNARVDHRVHDAVTYLQSELVARAIGYALHGSLSKELTVTNPGVDVPVDTPETLMLLALRYAFLIETKLDGARKVRYAEARRHVQSTAVDAMITRREQEGRPLPGAVGELAVDLSDSTSVAPEPARLLQLSKEESVVPLIGIMTTNIVQPFEINVSPAIRAEALEDLTIEMGLGRQFARDLVAAEEAADKALSGDGTNWIKWAAVGLGAASLVVATGGLVLSVAPGVAGAAAITSALAAFGPGGMVGGLLTAGALVGAGGGGVAVGLASPATTTEAVEAYVASQLTAALLRKSQGFDRDLTTWESLAETGIELRRDLARLAPISDDGAPALKQLERKLKTIDRALVHLSTAGLGPDEPDAAKIPAAALLERATEAFRAVDLDGDGIPDKPRVRSAAEDAGSAFKNAAAGTAGAVGSLLRRKRAVVSASALSGTERGGESEQVTTQ
ncbi:hypothetical protein [Isoptericola cucumis]|uniref:Alpha/beta hydrolase family protein n=1 Tax=Isoptericola cucumis TaxID=1776856 RepID=A0ABQ2B248_9MICO|nr:hypothetical protein [Isoptericola cucumis]GGI06080.1 hypothetical protein GCM10007368_09360 [Isoptericola cucumis]